MLQTSNRVSHVQHQQLPIPRSLSPFPGVMPLSSKNEENPFLDDSSNQDSQISPSNSPVPTRSIKKESSVTDNGESITSNTPAEAVDLPSGDKTAEPASTNSVKKRVAKSSARLMDEDEVEDENTLLRKQEMQLAEQLIIESQNAANVAEITVINDQAVVQLPKRKRGRPRKEEVAQRLAQIQESPNLSPRRRERRAAVEQREKLAKLKQEEEEQEALLRPNRRKYHSDDAFSSDDETFEVKKKVKRSPRKPIKSQSPKVAEKAPTPSPEKRTKKGRPSKQDNVTKKVRSIFQMDDSELFQDSINGSKENTPTASPQKVTNFLNFDNNGDSTFSSIPTISGIVAPKEEEADKDQKIITKFEAMPIPDVDEEGNVTDKQFMDKYFQGNDFEAETKGRFTDERAFFLEGSEGYFEQHALRFRPSSSSLTSKAPPLEYEEFIPMVNLGALIHAKERSALFKLHRELYHQWCFELSQGYSLNFYGVGSKANFIQEFVNSYLLDWFEDVMQEDNEYPVVMVVNGYNPSTKLKTVIHDIIGAVITPEARKLQNLKMPKHVAEAFPFLLSYLKRIRSTVKHNGLVKPDLVLVVHNCDGEAFRDERSQNYLSQLAAVPNVWFVTSTDNVNASLLWDLNRFKNFNFLWHDLTTYEPYSVEMSFKDVLSMGQSKKFLGSKGSRYVLASLSSNAKNLYKILLQAQVKILRESSTKAGRTGLRANVKVAVEFRSLYKQCEEAFVTSNEMNFRSILGEYVEHKMCNLTRNSRGTEVVFVPFSYDEMEKLLRDEFGIGLESS